MKYICIFSVMMVLNCYGQEKIYDRNEEFKIEGMRIVELSCVSAYPPYFPCDNDSLITSGAYVVRSFAAVSEHPPYIQYENTDKNFKKMAIKANEVTE